MTLGRAINGDRGGYFTCYVCGRPAGFVLHLGVKQGNRKEIYDMPFWCCNQHCDLMEEKQREITGLEYFEETLDLYV